MKERINKKSIQSGNEFIYRKTKNRNIKWHLLHNGPIKERNNFIGPPYQNEMQLISVYAEFGYACFLLFRVIFVV